VDFSPSQTERGSNDFLKKNGSKKDHHYEDQHDPFKDVSLVVFISRKNLGLISAALASPNTEMIIK